MTTTLRDWQKQVLGGIKKGEPLVIISMGRRTGKSTMAATAMAMHKAQFSSSWSDWKEAYVWPWNKKMSIDRKKIWGRIYVRHNKIALKDGDTFREYATNQEIFKKKLKYGEDA